MIEAHAHKARKTLDTRERKTVQQYGMTRDAKEVAVVKKPHPTTVANIQKYKQYREVLEEYAIVVFSTLVIWAASSDMLALTIWLILSTGGFVVTRYVCRQNSILVELPPS